jgi:trk system potassium uptake protein TrkH
MNDPIKRIAQSLPFLISTLAVASVLFHFGFELGALSRHIMGVSMRLALVVGLVSLGVQYAFPALRPSKRAWWVDLLYALVLLGLIGIYALGFSDEQPYLRPLLYIGVIWVWLRELADRQANLRSPYFNPARLFVGSFLLLCFSGALLLLLPGATHEPISPVDALFTSTSAVCVTGLITLDTATAFTRFGQIILALLIQVGGIGIMTFTSYFSYFFRGQSSFQEQMALRDLTSSDRLAEVFDSLRRIIVLTVLVELAGAALIYTSLDHSQFSSAREAIFFSGFHAISAFCNAGFSTLSEGLYDPLYRFNYPLLWIVALLFVAGGIGFPIAFNFWVYLRHIVTNRLIPAGFGRQSTHRPWILNLNTRLVLWTTGILLLGGWLGVLALEWHNTLDQHSLFGKLTVGFFSAATPRTAGFNVIPVADLLFPSLLLVMLLMWVGASPASTGGGIKTSTWAVATLSFISLARGKDRVELFGREISARSQWRSFALITLSLFALGTSMFLLALTERDPDFLELAFECISAYSTVGLSMGITAELSSWGKLVLVGTMFAGRVSLLTILIGLLPKEKSTTYRYPSEEILIN